MPDPADRNLQRSALMPQSLQQELKQTLFTPAIAPVFTRIAMTSGTSYILSGSNAAGRIGMRVHNYTAWASSNWVNICTSVADAMAVIPLGERLFGTSTSTEGYIWIPVAANNTLYMSASGALQTVIITEF